MGSDSAPVVNMRAVVVTVLAIAGGVGGGYGSIKLQLVDLEPLARPDPFTASQASRLADRLREEWQLDVARHALTSESAHARDHALLSSRLNEGESDKPPPPARERIEALEEHVRTLDPSMTPPHYRWQ